MVALVAVVVGLVLTSATCSLFEAVIYAVPASYAESLPPGRKSTRWLRGLKADVDGPITAILTLNTVANTAGAAVAGALAAKVLGSQWLGLFSGLLTFVILIGAEIVPKTIGVVHCRTLAPLVAGPVTLLVWLMRPLVWLISFMTTKLKGDRIDAVSDDEIAAMARVGEKHGTLDVTESQVIQNVIALDTQTVRDIMTPRPVMVSLEIDTPISEAARDAAVLEHSRIPVFESRVDHVTGMVLRRDILRAALAGSEGTVASLLHPLGSARSQLPLDELLKRMLAQREHLVLVVDEFGGVDGVVTLEDVLEEILGQEIVDEFDRVDDLREAAATDWEARALTIGNEDTGTGE